VIRYSPFLLLAIVTACGGRAEQSVGADAGLGTPVPAVDGGIDFDAGSAGDAASDAKADAPPLPPAGLSDGVCVPGDVRLGVYDPDCVYIIGSTQPGSAYAEALFHPIDPTRFTVGFGTNSGSHVVRGDQELLFVSLDFKGAYAFGPGLQTENMKQHLTHHTLVSTPACGSGNIALRSLHLHPRSGSGGPPGYYLCISQGYHYYEIGTSTELDIGGRILMAIDDNGAMLVRPIGGQMSIIDGTVEHPVAGIDATRVTDTRSRRGGGFLVAAATATDTSFPRLYDVATATGASTERGQYNLGSFRLTSVSALEPSGALLVQSTLRQPAEDGIVRLRIDAPPEIVFDESKDKSKGAVQLHITRLVTGP